MTIRVRLRPTSRKILWLWAAALALRHQVHAANHHFCGTSWPDADRVCHQACPSEQDSECTQAGHSCFGYTGCRAADNNNNKNNGNGGKKEEEDPYANNMCGPSWLGAMLACNKRCGGTGRSCPVGQTCYAATNCDRPKEKISANMIMSLLGDFKLLSNVRLGSVEKRVFEQSLLEFLKGRMEEEKVSIDGAGVTGQSYAERGGRRTTGNASAELIPDHQQRRRLPSSSSALDVSMTITGEYRPPPYRDVDLIVEESINRASRTLVDDFRARGRRGGTQFFERVEGMEAVRVADATGRPTRRPSGRPTGRPTEWPTSQPTPSPTRAFEQMVQTGHGTDLYVGTARSFGNVFEIKTKPASETVLIKGLAFYTAVAERVSYEVYSKEGTWVGHEGKLDSYEKVAEGRARSQGSCDELTKADCDSYFVQIPFDKFKNVAVRGGGGSRSFYITLKTKVIMYKRGKSLMTGGANDFLVQVETPDIEIYEGAGVLVYPFSLATEEINFMKPRGFLGQIWYERNPCEDGSMEWPCRTRSPVSQFQLSTSKPTKKPTGRPTPNPTRMPITQSPTAQKSTQPSLKNQIATPQTESPTIEIQNDSVVGEDATIKPSPPTVEYSYDEADVTLTNIVVTLHNVKDRLMDARESKKYSEVLMDFLRSHPSITGASVNVLNVTIWHQATATAEDDNGKSHEKGKKREKRPALQSGSKNRGKGRKLPVANSESIAPQGSRGLAENDSGEYEATGDLTVVTMDVTTIIKTANSVLPSDVTSVLLLHIIEEEKSKSALINLFHAESFYTFFLHISDVSGRIVAEVTNPPSPAPTSLSQMIAMNVSDLQSLHIGDEDAKEGRNIGRWVGASIGLLWWILTCFSLCCLIKARGEMVNEKLLQGSSKHVESTKLNDDLSNTMSAFRYSSYTKPTELGSTLGSNTSREHGGFFDEEESGSMDRDLSSGSDGDSLEAGNKESLRGDMLGRRSEKEESAQKHRIPAQISQSCIYGVKPKRDHADSSPKQKNQLYPTNREEKNGEESVKYPFQFLTTPQSGSDDNVSQTDTDAQDQPYLSVVDEDVQETKNENEIDPALREPHASVKKNRKRAAKKTKKLSSSTRGKDEDNEEFRRPSDALKEVSSVESDASARNDSKKSSRNTKTTKKAVPRARKGKTTEEGMGMDLIQSLILSSETKDKANSFRNRPLASSASAFIPSPAPAPERHKKSGRSGKRSVGASMVEPPKSKTPEQRSTGGGNHKSTKARGASTAEPSNSRSSDPRSTRGGYHKSSRTADRFRHGKDNASRPQGKSDLGTNMVEMLFA